MQYPNSILAFDTNLLRRMKLQFTVSLDSYIVKHAATNMQSKQEHKTTFPPLPHTSGDLSGRPSAEQ